MLSGGARKVPSSSRTIQGSFALAYPNPKSWFLTGFPQLKVFDPTGCALNVVPVRWVVAL